MEAADRPLLSVFICVHLWLIILRLHSAFRQVAGVHQHVEKVPRNTPAAGQAKVDVFLVGAVEITATGF